MRIVWHAPGIGQKDWIRYVFALVTTGEEIEDPNLECFEDNTIHVVSMVFKPLAAHVPYFDQLREKCTNIVLYHASDEWLSGGCGPYRYFDNVIKEFHSHFNKSEGLLTIPLGCPYNFRIDPLPVSSRRYLWSFVGGVHNTRIEMLRALDGLGPSFEFRTDGSFGPTGKKLNPDEYKEVLRQSVFLPCGMGVVTTETWRVYEALEAGCIPVLERRLFLDYYKNLFGEHPIPTFRTWKQARAYMARLQKNPNEMAKTQREVSSWWNQYKRTIQTDVQALLGASHRKELERFAESTVNKNVLVHETLRVAELMRHQSYHNLVRRSSNPLKPLRRIVLGMMRKDER
jgi:hypothetical protein